MDEEIKILIQAVDEATGTLKNIEDSVTKTAKNSSKANESLSESFSKAQGAMLNLGQAVQSIHNIFEIQENKTRLLENAQDRLENANLRLKQSVSDLSTAQKKLSDIEESHVGDSLTLEKAQLKLSRAQKELKEYTDDLANGYKFAEWKQRDYEDASMAVKEAQLEVNDAMNLGRKKEEELAQASKDLKDKQDAVTIANNNAERASRQLEKALSDTNWMYMDMGMQALSAAGNIGTFINTMGSATLGAGQMTTTMGGLTGAIGIGGMTATLGAAGALVGLGAVMLELSKNAKDLSPLEEYKNKLKELGITAIDTTNKMVALHQTMYPDKGTVQNYGAKYIEAPSINPQTINSAIPEAQKLYNMPKFGDFISRPGEGIANFSPNDTIIGVDDIGGLRGNTYNISIEGDNYGVDADNISDAIMRKLRMRITI